MSNIWQIVSLEIQMTTHRNIYQRLHCSGTFCIRVTKRYKYRAFVHRSQTKTDRKHYTTTLHLLINTLKIPTLLGISNKVESQDNPHIRRWGDESSRRIRCQTVGANRSFSNILVLGSIHSQTSLSWGEEGEERRGGGRFEGLAGVSVVHYQTLSC